MKEGKMTQDEEPKKAPSKKGSATQRSVSASLIARLGGLTNAQVNDVHVYTLPGRVAFLQKFLDEQPAEWPEERRQEAAKRALKIHMTRLTLARWAGKNKKGLT